MTEVTSSDDHRATSKGELIRKIPIDQVYDELATVVSAIGNKQFYDCISRFVARALGCGQRLVMRYSAFDHPHFIVNNFMNQRAEELYLSGLFRIDPLQVAARNNRAASVVNLRSSSDGFETDREYLSEIFKLAFIFDELAFLLPVPGGITFALCCEKVTDAFSPEELAHADAILPMISAIHERHLDEVFTRPMRQVGNEDYSLLTGDMYLILDRADIRVFASEGWQSCTAITDFSWKDIEKARQDGHTHLALSDNLVLHWESLGPQFQIAPGGTLFRVEHRSFGEISVPSLSVIDAFCVAQGLTPREQEIVKLILQGFPNSKIAEKLGISTGTIKNHRWRLYYKLDITSERELFLLFLSNMLSN
jgi:DNA-binding CsgD family transcriptional regulator